MTHPATRIRTATGVRRLAHRILLVLFTAALLLTTVSVAAPEKASAAPGPFYYIVSEYSGLPIMPLNHSKDHGAEIVQGSWQNAGAQHWKIRTSGTIDGQQRIRRFENRHSKYCVSNAGSYAVSRVLDQRQCLSFHTASEEWVVSSATDMWAGRPFSVWNHNSNQCMDVYGWSTEPYARITQYPCHGGANQLFRLVYVQGT